MPAIRESNELEELEPSSAGSVCHQSHQSGAQLLPVESRTHFCRCKSGVESG
jgi:hypothetical protein